MPAEKQEGTGSERRRRTGGGKLFQRTEHGQTEPDRAKQRQEQPVVLEEKEKSNSKNSRVP